MSAAPSLRELQHQLEGLFSLGGAADCEARLKDAESSLPVGGDGRLSPAQRIGIYTDMIFARIRDAIAEDFSATVTALGDDAWESLIARYVEAHPTDHPDLRLAGRHLPAYLRATETPQIADLASFEWALIDSFTAADAPLLSGDTLRALAPEAWPALELRSVPSLRLLCATSPIDQTRRKLLDGEPTDLETVGPFTLRVWRRELRVFHKRVPPFEHEALQHIARGTTFADLCEWIAEGDTGEDASEVAVRLLQGWLADELLMAAP